ncbi:FAD-binding oxidoreductase, partial [Candidatus Parcubacteria bacterium]|nr:FAD-binding oxidoreductase [Candidatus Parcubacteria bacterium]
LGSDLTGAALGQGIMLVFPAHMNRILELDSKSGVVTVEPGVNYAKLQQALNTHGRFLPPYPSSINYSTIGGAVANNKGGEKSIKYGSTLNFIKSLRFVLANGEVIETRRLSRRELNKKMGLSTFEGEIYRSIDALIEENGDLIDSLNRDVTKNTSGYNLPAVKKKDGSFDLTPLIAGSQGTLGIISEVTMLSEPYNPKTTLIAAFFNDLHEAEEAIHNLRKLPKPPSSIEVVDKNLLDYVSKINPNQLKNVVKSPLPKLAMLVEFDDPSDRIQAKLAKKAEKIIEKAGAQCRLETDPVAKDELWKIRHSAATLIAHSVGGKRALPIIEDGVVPIDQITNFLKAVYELFNKHKLPVAVWGHGGNANFHVQPFLDLSMLGDRQKVFRLMDDYYTMVLEFGGSLSGQHNDGRLRGPYLEKMFGSEAYELFGKLKAVFDPYGTMNPGVKMDVAVEDLKPILRTEYSLEHLYDYMPRT